MTTFILFLCVLIPLSRMNSHRRSPFDLPDDYRLQLFRDE
jgi:hypothetical protein